MSLQVSHTHCLYADVIGKKLATFIAAIQAF
jgi:hypothetical protein